MHAKWCMTIFYEIENTHIVVHTSRGSGLRNGYIMASNPLEICESHLNIASFGLWLRLKDYKDVQYYQEQVLIIKIISANTHTHTDAFIHQPLNRPEKEREKNLLRLWINYGHKRWADGKICMICHWAAAHLNYLMWYMRRSHAHHTHNNAEFDLIIKMKYKWLCSWMCVCVFFFSRVLVPSLGRLMAEFTHATMKKNRILTFIFQKMTLTCRSFLPGTQVIQVLYFTRSKFNSVFFGEEIRHQWWRWMLAHTHTHILQQCNRKQKNEAKNKASLSFTFFFKKKNILC